MNKYLIYIVVLFICSCEPVKNDKVFIQGTFAQSQQIQLANPVITTDSIFFQNKCIVQLELGLENSNVYSCKWQSELKQKPGPTYKFLDDQ